MIYRIFSDCHWSSADPSKAKIEHGKDCVYLGDNFEMKNIPKKKVDFYIDKYKRFLDAAKRMGTHVLAGNHQVSVGKKLCGVYEITLHGVLFRHGHRMKYSKMKDYRVKWAESYKSIVTTITCDFYSKKAKKWENRKPGQWGVFRFVSKLLSKARKIVPSTTCVSEDLWDKAFKLAETRDFHTICIGHIHPSQLIDESRERVVNGVLRKIRFVIVMRGKTTIDL